MQIDCKYDSSIVSNDIRRNSVSIREKTDSRRAVTSLYDIIECKDVASFYKQKAPSRPRSYSRIVRSLFDAKERTYACSS